MTKVVLTDLANLQNETTAVNAINKNNAILEVASDNTLSRNGASPNQMLAVLDMNSNPIINLPAAGSDTEPVRRAEYELDIAALSSPGGLLPNSVSNTILADMPANTYKGRGSTSGDPQDLSITNLTHVFNVKDYGAVGNGVTDDAAAIQAATLACINAGLGTVYFPTGTYACGSIAINLLNTIGLSFQGAGSANNAGQEASTLLFTASSGNLIRLDGTEGITFTNLAFTYNNPAFTDNLINISQVLGGANTSFTTFKDFNARGIGVSTAGSLFFISKSLNTRFERGFIQNAVAGIQGAAGAFPDFCNGVTIDGVWFNEHLDEALLVGGQNWGIYNCVFEPNRGSGDATNCVYVNPVGVDGLTFINNSMSDAVGLGIWLNAAAGPIKGGIISGNFIQGGAFSMNLAAASSGLTITGNFFNNGSGVGNGLITSANLCTDVIAIGNSFDVTPSTITLFNNAQYPVGNSILDNHDGLGIRVMGGKVIMTGLPTSAPATTGSLWNSSGTVHIV